METNVGCDAAFTNTTNGKRITNSVTFSTSRNISMLFAATVNVNSSATPFYDTVGFNGFITANYSSDSNITCLLQQFADYVGIDVNLFIIYGYNSSQNGVQLINVTVLDTPSISGYSVLRNLSNTVYYHLANFTCPGIDVSNVNYTTNFTLENSFRISSYNLDVTTLLLKVSLLQRLTSPISLDYTRFSSVVTTAPTPNISIGTPTCSSSSYCTQKLDLIFDLNNMDCKGFSDSISLWLYPACNGADAVICQKVLNSLGTKHYTDTFKISADWCANDQSIQLSPNSFLLYQGANQITPLQQIASASPINGVINIQVVSKIAGSDLSTTDISSLSF